MVAMAGGENERSAGGGRAQDAVSQPDLLSKEEQSRVLSSSRLAVKLIGMVFVIVVLLGAVSFVLVDRIFATMTPAIRHDLSWKALHGVIELSNTAAIGVIASDREAVAAASRELTADPDVVAILVKDDSGIVFAHGAVSFNWDDYAERVKQVVERKDVLLAVAPIEIEGLAVGKVFVAVSKKRLLAGEQLRVNLLLAAAGGGLVALLLALAFVQLYIAPLLKVTTEAFAKLERTTRQALEAARLKSEFLANMSHEIRTPMNGIMGVTKLALGSNPDPAMRRYLELIDTSSRGLLSIVNDVLDFSKIEAGKYDLHARPFDLRQMVQECMDVVAERASEKGLRLKHRVADDVPRWVRSDPDRIKQVLINLLGNAVKFTPAGKVSLDVRVHERGSGTDALDAVRLHFRVRDTGVGISQEAQSLLFQAFTQVDGSYQRVHGGTGLGLAIAKRLSALLGGEIGVISEAGKGSEFWFTAVTEQTEQMALSDSAPQGAASDKPTVERRRLRSGHPVLVVDDNEINRFVAVEHLRQMGFATETAVNGAEALEAVKTKRYSAVLMDCQMPVMDGYTAARKIRAWEDGKARIPIIAVTAHALVGERDKAVSAGMDDYLPKPFRPSELEHALVRWTRLSRPTEEATPVPAQVASAPGEIVELDDDAELGSRLAELFLRASPEQFQELETALAARDEGATRAFAHKLKGGLYAVGASRLTDAVEELRTDVAAGQWDAADLRMRTLVQRFARVLDAVRAQAVTAAAAEAAEAAEVTEATTDHSTQEAV